MTFKDVNKLVKKTGLKCTYYQWPEKSAPQLPYALFYFPQTNDEYAEDENFSNITALNIEIYTKNKDFATEKKVEDVLRGEGLAWTKTESYLDSEKMYEALYELQIVIDEEV